MSNPMGAIACERLGLEKQQAASALLLEAAYMSGDAATIKHLREHAHKLLDQYQDATRRYYAALKDMMR